MIIVANKNSDKCDTFSQLIELMKMEIATNEKFWKCFEIETFINLNSFSDYESFILYNCKINLVIKIIHTYLESFVERI